MAGKRYITVPARDPDEHLASSLPPLLRIDEKSNWRATVAVLEHIRQTLREYGIPVVEPTTIFTIGAPIADVHEPERLRNRGRWDVGTDDSVRPVPSPQDNDNQYNWTGIEIRSPALWAMNTSFDEVKYVVNLLKSRFRLRVNSTCGFHVHVGNGRRFFAAQTIKRLGAFLWAADPLLSRLHAPWRRVGPHSASIRYASRLARRGMETADARRLVRRSARVIRRETQRSLDTLPVAPWSDTAREELDYGGRQGWEDFARHWRETAPRMRIPVDVDGEVSDGPDSDGESSPSHPPSSPSNPPSDASYHSTPSHLSSPSHHSTPNPSPNPSSHSTLSNHSTPSHHSSSDSNPDSGGSNPIETSVLGEENVGEVADAGGAVNRRLQYFMQTEPYLTLLGELTGETDPNTLSSDEQHRLLAMVQCQSLFGHTELPSLSADEEAEVFRACAPYVESNRSSWAWDPGAERWFLDNGQLGDLLTHVRPRRTGRVNGPRLIGRLERLATLLEVDADGAGAGELSQEGVEFVSRQELDEAIQTNSGLEALLTGLREYDHSPEPVHDSTENLDDEELDRLIHQYEEEIATHEQNEQQEGNGSQVSGDDDDYVPDVPEDIIDEHMDEDDERSLSGESASYPEPSPTPSIFSDSSAGDSDFNPPAWQVLMESNNEPTNIHTPSTKSLASVGESPASSVFMSNVSTSPPPPPQPSSSNSNSTTGSEQFFTPPVVQTSPENSSIDSGNSFYTPRSHNSHSSQSESSGGGASPAASSHKSTAGKSPSQRRRHKRRARKLRPHDVDQLPEYYISTISAETGLTARDWDRVSWLPRGPSHPAHRQDPGAPHSAPDGCAPSSSSNNNNKRCAAHAQTRTRAGLAALTACGSAAEVGALLGPGAGAARLNYNFEAYGPEGLGERFGNPNRRTVEFREAGGSLDAAWIALWARVCVGAARWCRDADARDFLGVLAEVDRWEEGEAGRRGKKNVKKEGGDDDGDGEDEEDVDFDVCDLLDLIGLPAEAEGIRARERRMGPPR